MERIVQTAPEIRLLLTPRETEYLLLAAMGYKNKDIGCILTVTRSMVKKTLENIFQKLHAKNRANAVWICSRNT